MSRLRPLTVPFVQGQDESVDPKVLPDGVFSRVENGRFDKAGSLALRRGWRPADMSTMGDDGTLIGGTNICQDLYSVGGSLVGLFQTTASQFVSTYVEHSATVPWVRRFGVVVPPVTDVRAVGNVADLPADVVRVSTAITADGVWGAVVQATTSKATLRVFRVSNDETTFYDDLSVATVKLVSFGSTFGLLENTGAVLRLRVVTPTNSAPVSTSTTTLVTATITDFDAATAIQHTDTPVGVHVAYVSGGAVSYAQFTSAGSQTGSTKTVVASAATRCRITSNDTRVHVAYDNGAAEIQLLTFDATGAFTTSAGPTAVNAGQPVVTGQFCVGCTTNNVFVGSGLSATKTALVNQLTNSHGTNTLATHDSSSLVGGFVFPKTGTPAVTVARGNAAQTKLNDVVLTSGTQPWAVLAFGVGTTYGTPAGTQAVYAPCQNASGVCLVGWRRLSDTTTTTLRQAETSGESLSTRQAAIVTLKTMAEERRPGAVFGGSLYLTGGIVTEYAHGGVVENGLVAPVIASATASNGAGTLAGGDYQYAAIVTWTDRLGRVHRSPVSRLVSKTVDSGASEDTVTVLVHVAKTLRRDADLLTQPKVELYRTEVGPGELFYLVATAVVDEEDDETGLVDTLPDASIIDNRRLYTEGEFGAVSGALEIAPAFSSSYAAAVRERLVLGGDTLLQYSQLLLPAEPAAFVQPGVSGPAGLVFQDAVEEPITAVAGLDDLVVVATARNLFVVPLGGGPNLAGVGEFPSPARLASSVGVYDWRSVVESGAGLWFLADPGKLYLLPRGQASPTYAGGPVEDEFAQGTVVGAAFDQDDHVLAWAVAGNAADDVLVTRDERGGQWSVDRLPFTPHALVGHDDTLYAVDDAGDVWFRSPTAYGDDDSGATAVALVVETGDVQGFGAVGGWGRLAGVELLGEFQSAAAVLCEISYDSGKTYSSLGAHTVSGLAAGDAFQRQWYPANQRGGKFRLRFTMTPSSTTAEGCRLAGFALYYTQRNGPTRLDSAKRR